MVAISVWLDGNSLLGSRGLAGLLHDWGAPGVRLAIASVLAFLIFGEDRTSGGIDGERRQTDPGSISWPLLLEHGAAMAVFVFLSSMIYGKHGSGLAADLEIVAWTVTGAAAMALAACALIPAPVWIEKFRGMRDALLFAPAAGLAACVLGNYARRLWPPLTHATFAVVSVMLRPFLAHIVADPSAASIGSPTFHVEIQPECSGYEGMGLILAITCAWLWFLRRQWRFPNVLVLIPAGLAAVWILNAGRIAALILIGNAGAPGVALGGFHSQFGWIAFSIVSLGICSAARRISWFTAAAPSRTAVVSVANPVAVYLAPFLAILAAALIARAASADFEWLYGLRVAAAGAALWFYRRSYRQFEWRIDAGALLAGVMVFGLWIALDRVASIPAAGAPAAFTSAPLLAKSAWIAFRLLGAIVTVPIAEELAFRGFLLRRLAAADFEGVAWSHFGWLPFLVSSLAFGILHGDRWIAGTLAGMVYALAMIRRGRIADAIAAHAVTNALLSASILITGNWQFW